MTCCWQSGVQRSFFEMFSKLLYYTILYGTIDILQPRPFQCLRLLPKISIYNAQFTCKGKTFLCEYQFKSDFSKKYLKITILVFWSQIVQTRIRIIIKIIFGRLMRISVRAHCRCIHLFPNRAHDASKITCAIYNCISVRFIFGIEFFVSVFWIDLL